MFHTLTNLIAAALLPPLVLVLMTVAGLVLLRRYRTFAVILITSSCALLYLLSTPWLGGVLQKSLEVAGPVTYDALGQADAIVVLGGGRRLAAPEYGADTLTGLSLERLRYAARLHRSSGLPLLVTGGRPGNLGTHAEAEIMRDILQGEYGITPRWIERDSETTWDNARLSAPLLRRGRVASIVLISHAWHLRRAIPLFEAAGLRVIPAGVQFADTRVDSIFSLLPSPSGLRDSTFALHEWLGILWYKLRSLSRGQAA